MTPELMIAATRGPQVEPIADVMARAQARRNAQREAEQQYTLGQINLQEARLKLAQVQRDQADDERGRALFAGGSPQAAPQQFQGEDNPQPTAQPGPAAPPVTGDPPAAPGQAQTAQAAPPQPAAQPRRPTQAQIYAAYGPKQGAAIVKAMTDADTAGVDLATKKSKLGTDLLDYEGSLAAMVKAADYSQDAVAQAVQMLGDHGYQQEAEQLRAHIAQNPNQIKALMDQAIAASPKQRELGNSETATSNTKANNEATRKQTEARDANTALNEKSIREQQAANAEETKRHNVETASEAKQRIFIEGKNADINAKKFALEFGGDAVKGWAKQVAENPDTANTVPAGLRTVVMKQFTSDTGLPFPKPLAGTAVDQERAARNTLSKIPRIEQLLADPEISSRIGPILGHLGNAEQAVGTAVGLSDSASRKAQELRTLMRYTVMGEGRVLLGGRLPQQLMQKLESSSIKDTMDPNLAAGSLKAMGGAANDVLDETFHQRFGANATRPVPAAKASAFMIPAGARVQQNQAGKRRYSTDSGKTWVNEP